MKLITPDTFRARYFVRGNAPTIKTVRRWVGKGLIPGKVIDTGNRRQYFIDAEAFELLQQTANSRVDAFVNAILLRDRNYPPHWWNNKKHQYAVKK